VNAETPLDLINGQDSVFWQILTFAIAQVEKLPMMETVTNWPFVIEHCLYKIVIALDLCEGECPFRMIH